MVPYGASRFLRIPGDTVFDRGIEGARDTIPQPFRTPDAVRVLRALHAARTLTGTVFGEDIEWARGTGTERAGTGRDTARRGDAPPRESEPRRLVLTGDAAALVRRSAQRMGIPLSALVVQAVTALTAKPSRTLLRRYREIRNRLAGAGIDADTLAELDEIVLLSWCKLMRRGRG